MSHLLKLGVQGTQSVSNLILDTHVMVNWQQWKYGICWPVLHDYITGSGVQLNEVICLFKIPPLTSFWFSIDQNAQDHFFRRNLVCFLIKAKVNERISLLSFHGCIMNQQHRSQGLNSSTSLNFAELQNSVASITVTISSYLIIIIIEMFFLVKLWEQTTCNNTKKRIALTNSMKLWPYMEYFTAL